MIAGGMRNPGDLPFDVWSVYLAVKDARETTDAAVANGGTVMVPAMEVQALGTMGVVTDPSGATIGLWQPGEHRGMGIVARARHARVVRTAHDRLPRGRELLREGVPLAAAHDGRH